MNGYFGGIEPPPQHLPFQKLAAPEMAVPQAINPAPPHRPYLRADSQHTSVITKSKGTEMKTVVIGGTRLIGSKLVAAITQVSHA